MNNVKYVKKPKKDSFGDYPLSCNDYGEGKFVLEWDHGNSFYCRKDNSELIAAIKAEPIDIIDVLSSNYEDLEFKYNIPKETKNIFNLTDYGKDAGGVYITVRKVKDINENHMPYGSYLLTAKDHTVGFEKLELRQDDYLDLNNKEINDVKNNIESFYSKRQIYKDLKIRHKGASLLYGSPGGGKTSAILNIINKLQHLEMYTIYVPKSMSLTTLASFKNCFAGKNVFIILEEITERLQYGTEDLLNFTDGYASWENCYVIATTNYPEQLPENLTDRPGRFNYIVEFKNPTDDEKRKYLKFKGINENQIAEIVKQTKNASFDYISQIVLQSRLLELDPSEYIKILYKNRDKVKTAFKKGNKVSLTSKESDKSGFDY